MILAIDTCMARCSAALWQDGALVVGQAEDMNTGHAERLVPMIEELLAQVSLPAKALGGVLATVGPGTFTGQRVGLSVARGLMVAADAPGLGVTCFEALAAAHAQEREGETCHVVFDARREQFYFQSLMSSETGIKPLGAPECIDAESVRARIDAMPGLVFGSAAKLFGGADVDCVPDARVFGGLWWQIAPGADRLVRPLYLRAPDAKPPAYVPPARGDVPQ